MSEILRTDMKSMKEQLKRISKEVEDQEHNMDMDGYDDESEMKIQRLERMRDEMEGMIELIEKQLGISPRRKKPGNIKNIIVVK